MASRLSTKGQVVIPAKLRKKYHLEPGTPLAVEEKDGQIVIVPLPSDPIAALYGVLKDAGPLTDDLLAERRREERHEAKRAR